MAIIKCKMCGGDLELSEDMSVAVCEYCGTKQTVPKVDNEKKIKLFERANRLRKASEFDKAAGVYESIIADFDTEAEAYWGLLLCNYGIEYVDDPATKKKVPTCHRSSFESVMKDPNLELALENADLVAQRVYREEAKQIEELRRSIIEVSSKEEPYDVFISYKELSADGERTVDSVIAQDIYKELTAMGYRVFFSRISLESKLGTEYEPYIFAALNSARVMLVVGTDYENFNAVWVKNEWSRYLSLIARGDKKTLIPVFKDIDAYDMPEEFSKLAAQNMGKIGAMQDLMHGVEKILGGKKEEAPAAAPVQQTVAAPGVASLLERSMMFLEDRDWSSADEYFDKVLDIDPKNGEAYYGKLMVELKLTSISEIEPSESGARKLVTSAKAYKRFGQFGTTERKAELEARLKYCDEQEQLERERKAEEAKLRAEAERIERERKAEAARIAAERKAEEARRKAEAERIERERKAEAARIAAERKAEEARRKAEAERIERERKLAELPSVRAKLYKFGKLISAGDAHTVGLRSDGTVVAVGDNDEGRCNVSGWRNIVAISAGFAHTVGLRSDGTVVAVGYNNHGQCDVSGWKDIVAVAAGYSHTVGLRPDGTVVATKFIGEIFNYGQCDVSGWTDIVAIAAAEYHTVGLRSDGTVVAVGDNECGQCDVSGWKDIVAVAASECHTVGLRSDGTVVAVGDNYEGQCDVSGWRDIVAISAGSSHTVGLRSDGTVVATKYTGDQKYYYGWCDASGWKDIVAVSAGGAHTMGLRSDGTVVAVGDNECGQCDVSGWKLFNSADTYEEEQIAIREEKIAALTEEKAKLTAELPNLQGMFKAGKRKEAEARIAAIDKELAELQK